MRQEDTSDAKTILHRRHFIAGSAGAAAAAVLARWTPVFRVAPASAQAACAPPPNFPSSIALYQQAFQNWSGEIVVEAVWTCAPATPNDVVTVVNWAHANGYKVRPRGLMQNWSPLTLASGPACPANIVLLDTTQHLTAVSVSTATSPATVTAQTGITMEALLTTLEGYGLGVATTPAPGHLTLGGVLAVGGHGTVVPATGQTLPVGHTYGSLSNLILGFTAVVWNAASGHYVLASFSRSDPQSKAFLVHAGRAFIISVTLQVGANQRIRCQNYVDIPASILYGTPGTWGSTLSSFLNSVGRVSAIWFPFTSIPWLRVWSVTPSKPLFSREVDSPYNYPFADELPSSLTSLMTQILEGDTALATTFGPLQYTLVAAGLAATASFDLWGWSKNLLLYLRPTSLPVTANSYAVITSRANFQRVVNDFTTYYQGLVASYQARGLYPMNAPLEIRATGLDNPSDVSVAFAGSPQLSAVRPRPDQPGWNIAVWIDVTTLPNTPSADAFYRDLEQWMYGHFTGSYAMVRAEWSKGWAYTATGAWSDPGILGTTMPNSYRIGQAAGDNWDAASSVLAQYDPFRIFTAPVLDALLL